MMKKLYLYLSIYLLVTVLMSIQAEQQCPPGHYRDEMTTQYLDCPDFCLQILVYNKPSSNAFENHKCQNIISETNCCKNESDYPHLTTTPSTTITVSTTTTTTTGTSTTSRTSTTTAALAQSQRKMHVNGPMYKIMIAIVVIIIIVVTVSLFIYGNAFRNIDQRRIARFNQNSHRSIDSSVEIPLQVPPTEKARAFDDEDTEDSNNSAEHQHLLQDEPSTSNETRRSGETVIEIGSDFEGDTREDTTLLSTSPTTEPSAPPAEEDDNDNQDTPGELPDMQIDDSIEVSRDEGASQQ